MEEEKRLVGPAHVKVRRSAGTKAQGQMLCAARAVSAMPAGEAWCFTQWKGSRGQRQSEGTHNQWQPGQGLSLHGQVIKRTEYPRA